jgi:hypothetical protein
MSLLLPEKRGECDAAHIEVPCSGHLKRGAHARLFGIAISAINASLTARSPRPRISLNR